MSSPPSPPLPHSHTYTPSTYRCLRTEQGVFTTPGYSEHVKPHWRYVDAAAADKSAKAIWHIFETHRMDIARKFIMMGRTRSLRYALRPGGRKYGPLPADPESKAGSSVIRRDGTAVGAEIGRTGKVYDQGKLDGAGIFAGYEDRCWQDQVYQRLWDEWKAGQAKEVKGKAKERNSKGGANLVKHEKGGADEEGQGKDSRSAVMDDVKPRRRVHRGAGTEPESEDQPPAETSTPSTRASKRRRRD